MIWNGTLVNTLEDLADSVNEALEKDGVSCLEDRGLPFEGGKRLPESYGEQRAAGSKGRFRGD